MLAGIPIPIFVFSLVYTAAMSALPHICRPIAERSFARKHLAILQQIASIPPKRDRIASLFMGQALMWRQRANLAFFALCFMGPFYFALCYIVGRWWPTSQLWRWGAIPCLGVIPILIFIRVTGKKLEAIWHEAALKALLEHLPPFPPF